MIIQSSDNFTIRLLVISSQYSSIIDALLNIIIDPTNVDQSSQETTPNFPTLPQTLLHPHLKTPIANPHISSFVLDINGPQIQISDNKINIKIDRSTEMETTSKYI